MHTHFLVTKYFTEHNLDTTKYYLHVSGNLTQTQMRTRDTLNSTMNYKPGIKMPYTATDNNTICYSK